LPVFRFNSKASAIARSAKALLKPEGDAPRNAIPDAEQAEIPERARPRTPERRKKRKNRQQKRRNRELPPERIETAQLRQRPDFVIIGTQRGGTTSLYRYLSQHPDIGSALRKEVHFFDRYYEKGMDWYLAHFPMSGEVPVVGEASPYYLFHPDVPDRVRGVLPHAKFIVLLRNPVDRAYSHYSMNVGKGFESLSFEDAIHQERERLSCSDDPASISWQYYSYIERGVYVDQLKRWMSVFPREQFLVIKSEDFYKDPERVLCQTLAYVGLEPWGPANFRVHHLSEYADMNPATRKRLREYFVPYNERLYAFLGRDLGWERER
jgi:hypothetical protein